MLRPRDSHDLRLLDANLVIDPPGRLRWLYDVFSNSIALANIDGRATELRFESRIQVEHYGLAYPDFSQADNTLPYPFAYTESEFPDLLPYTTLYHSEPDGAVTRWARGILERYSEPVRSNELLHAINRAVYDHITYEPRYTIGVQSPEETLERQAGTCRDLTLLMMEAVRSLGFAARFVSGYLYDPALDPELAGTEAHEAPLQGAGATHAWVQVYLPYAGWVDFDPTNTLVGGTNLIRVAVARDPLQALPLQGTYYGSPDDFLEMEVTVQVSAENDG